MQTLAASLLYCSNLFRFTFSKWNRQRTADVQIGDGCSTHTHTHVQGPFLRDYPCEPVPERQNQSGFYWSWAMCKSAPCSRQITTPAPHHSVFYRPDALPAAHQQCQSTEGQDGCSKIEDIGIDVSSCMNCSNTDNWVMATKWSLLGA